MNNFLNKSTKSISTAALILASANLLSGFLGFVRDSLFASRLGAGDLTDSYLAAFRLPDLMFNLLLMGALAAGLIPVFANYYYKSKEGEHEAFDIISGLLNYAMMGWLALSIIIFIFAPQVLKLFVPGFPPEKVQLSANFTRIMILSPLFLTFSAIWGGVLQSLKKFMVFAFAPVFYNIGIIFGVTSLIKILGPNGLAWGVVLGAFLHMVIQLPSVWQVGWRPHLSFKFHPGIKEIILLTIPRAMSIGVTQINVFIMTLLASGLASGSLTIFNFANNLQAVPVGLVGVSLATAAFPSFSEALAKNNLIEMASILRKSVSRIIFLVLPFSVLFFVIREPLIKLIFGNNFFGATRFGQSDVLTTAATFQFFTIAIFAQSLIPLIGRAFFALKDTKTPFFIGFASEFLNFILSYAFSYKLGFGVAGLALGFAIASIFNVLMLWNFLIKNNSALKNLLDWPEIIKTIILSILAGIAAYASLIILHLNYIFELIVAGVAALAIYILFGWLLGQKEMRSILSVLKK